MGVVFVHSISFWWLTTPFVTHYKTTNELWWYGDHAMRYATQNASGGSTGTPSPLVARATMCENMSGVECWGNKRHTGDARHRTNNHHDTQYN